MGFREKCDLLTCSADNFDQNLTTVGIHVEASKSHGIVGGVTQVGTVGGWSGHDIIQHDVVGVENTKWFLVGESLVLVT